MLFLSHYYYAGTCMSRGSHSSSVKRTTRDLCVRATIVALPRLWQQLDDVAESKVRHYE
jgi:hypothetical protein